MNRRTGQHPFPQIIHSCVIVLIIEIRDGDIQRRDVPVRIREGTTVNLFSHTGDNWIAFAIVAEDDSASCTTPDSNSDSLTIV